MNYRHDANQYLASAGEKLNTQKVQDLKYAALELRMAMEAITYDRAIAYKDEFPPEEFQTWQPRKVMRVLLDIDPIADKDSTISFGLEEEYGVQAPVMTSLGTEKVLNMNTLSKHYDALGSYLHIQSMKQVREGKKLNTDKMRTRLKDITVFLKAVLSSPVFNSTMGSFATIKCLECNKPVRKRIPHDKETLGAECFECHSTYTLSLQENGQVEWKPHHRQVLCGNPDCDEEALVWEHEEKIGRFWTCPGCKGTNEFAAGVLFIPFKEDKISES
ncbi:MAG: hypothetical protein COA71_00365 [SAR86 cluster bacterium]|uniref:Uncharacterized protein n=1 Tax=SAR86 cluster bacterium TaxID=2030880 RepID=A0A2A5CIN5_9GAMM|nr:MAG: hypothetical protein COA71_00365 [SAR86 cluster bacterium]